MIDAHSERKAAVEYCFVRRLLRPNGGWSILWGLFATVSGIVGMQYSSANAILLVLGLFMIVEGIVILKAPSPAMILAECATFLVIAGWNIYILFANLSAGAKEVGPWPVIAIVQILVARDFYRKYKRFAYLSNCEPPRMVCEEMDGLIKTVIKGNPKKREDLVTLTAFVGVWKAGLFGEEMLLIDQKKQDVCFVKREEVKLRSEGNVVLGKDVKVVLEAGERRWKGQMKPPQYERLETWLARQPEAPKPY